MNSTPSHGAAAPAKLRKSRTYALLDSYSPQGGPAKLLKSRSTSALHDSYSPQGALAKPRKSRAAALADSVLVFAGAPANALRRASKRVGVGSKTQDEDAAAERAETQQLEEAKKSQSKKLQSLYRKPSRLQLMDKDDIGGNCEVGMVRLVYSKIRSLRETKDYENVHKRNSWKDLVGDLRHGIRVCLKAQAFIEVLSDAARAGKEPSSPAWCIDVEKQRVWMELLGSLGEATPKGSTADKELENFKAMIMASRISEADEQDTSAQDGTETSTACTVAAPTLLTSSLRPGQAATMLPPLNFSSRQDSAKTL